MPNVSLHFTVQLFSIPVKIEKDLNLNVKRVCSLDYATARLYDPRSTTYNLITSAIARAPCRDDIKMRKLLGLLFTACILTVTSKRTNKQVNACVCLSARTFNLVFICTCVCTQ